MEEPFIEVVPIKARSKRVFWFILPALGQTSRLLCLVSLVMFLMLFLLCYLAFFFFFFLGSFFRLWMFWILSPCPFVLMSHTHTQLPIFWSIIPSLVFVLLSQLEIRFSSSLLKKTTSCTWGLWRKSCWVQAQVTHR